VLGERGDVVKDRRADVAAEPQADPGPAIDGRERVAREVPSGAQTGPNGPSGEAAIRGMSSSGDFATSIEDKLIIRTLLVAALVAVTSIGSASIADADPLGQLRSMLPAGYGPDSCQPIDNAEGAILTCSGNSLPGGPFAAKYFLANDPDLLNSVYHDIVNDPGRKLMPCAPGGPAAASRWGGGNGESGQGWVACSFPDQHGNADVVWTRDSSLFFGHADSHDLPSLFDWFMTTGMNAG
jgi:hypothetical protein